jgi:hypothetical protein
MLHLEFDFAELERYALSLNAAADQIPFALATALNRSADVTRNLLIKSTWPTAVKQRNQSFIAASLTTREARASKTSLAVEIYDKLNRGNLQMQAKGGQRVARGNNMAIPSSNITRGASGVPSRFKPKNMPTAVRKGDVLYGRDRKGRLKLLYVLKHATPIPKRVPFYEDFAASMSRELTRTIPLAVKRAMETRR